MKTIVLSLFLFISVNLSAQTKTNSFLIPKIKAGLNFPGLTSYYFTAESHLRRFVSDPSPVLPGYSIGVGLEIPALISFYDIDASLSLEVSSAQASTGEVETNAGRFKSTLTSLPIMLWTTMKTDGKIVPFVRLGAGTGRYGLIEKYEYHNMLDFNFKKWIFSWGLGGGIEVNFDNYNISLFVDGIIVEGGLEHEFSDGRSFNYNFRNGTFNSGFQIGFKL